MFCMFNLQEEERNQVKEVSVAQTTDSKYSVQALLLLAEVSAV